MSTTNTTATAINPAAIVIKRPIYTASRQESLAPGPGETETHDHRTVDAKDILVGMVVSSLPDGVAWLKRYLSPDEQQALVARCLEYLDAPVGGYVPTVRGGGKMRIRMVCLGRHWNARTYTYEATREDHDHAPVPPVPTDFVAMASRIAREAGFPVFTPDICLINAYDADGRMGLHQDKDESRESIETGLPVVSISLGATARFLFGGLRRRDPVEALMLESGDAFVFGGSARLRYHGVTRIIPGTAPPGIGIQGRINLTFRQY